MYPVLIKTGADGTLHLFPFTFWENTRGTSRLSQPTETRHPQRANCLPYRLLMLEKEIILKKQLAARCLLQCGVDRKLPASAGVGY